MPRQVSRLVLLRVDGMLGDVWQWDANANTFVSDGDRDDKLELRCDQISITQSNVQYDPMSTMVCRALDRVFSIMWRWRTQEVSKTNGIIICSIGCPEWYPAFTITAKLTITIVTKLSSP